jgi:hypothetical protein
MKSTTHKRRRGLTLVEMALAMTLGIVISGLLMILVKQQLSFLSIFNIQTFLVEEAPMVSMHVGRMAGKADRFRLHASVSDALAGRDPRLTDSPVLLMTFQQPDGTSRSTIISFETVNGSNVLNYYLVPTGASPTVVTPQWAITRKAQNVTFAVEQGVLRMTLRGHAGEQIVYSGTMQL